jgi:hypothetical protein
MAKRLDYNQIALPETRPFRAVYGYVMQSSLTCAWEKNMKANDRRLMWHGMFLFLLGLITGLVEQRFTNIRMGLSAHLEGVMNGILLVALGANRDKLPRRQFL